MGVRRRWGLLRDAERAEGLLSGADKHILLSSQFTQSALDCMGVEVGRLRAFLQVRAQLFERFCLLSCPILTSSPNADFVSHPFPVP